MVLTPEGPRMGRWVVFSGFFVLLGICAVIVYDATGAVHRLLVVRIGCGTVLAVVLLKLAKTVRAQLDRQPASGFETAARRPDDCLAVDPFFEKLKNEVENSLRDRSYFEHTLQVRLCSLFERTARNQPGTGCPDPAKGFPGAAEPEPIMVPPPQAHRRTLVRRGVSLRKLRALVEKLEERA